MGFLCLCQFVHPEHKVSDLPPLRLYHISKRYIMFCIYIGHKVELANQVNIMTLAISIFHLNPLILLFVSQRCTSAFKCIIGKQEMACTEAGKIPCFINWRENLAFTMENSEWSPYSTRVSGKTPIDLTGIMGLLYYLRWVLERL